MKFLLLIVAAALALTAPPVRADDPVVPGGSFPASRYETLWTKSPFAVATVEADEGPESPDYSLVGITNINGISYASVIEKEKNEHFLISTDKATRGMTLTSITIGHNGSDTYALVQKDGQPITLKLEQGPAMAGANSNAPPMNPFMPGGNNPTPPLPMPGVSNVFPGSGSTRPFARFHRPPIHLPFQPGQQQQYQPGQQQQYQPGQQQQYQPGQQQQVQPSSPQ
jgi:hypothetical protein